jgi:hypothetical protein
MQRKAAGPGAGNAAVPRPVETIGHKAFRDSDDMGG